MTTREFHFTESSSDKFWRISYADIQVDVQYGRIGNAGQSSSKSYADEKSAQQAAEKQIAEKLKKGYVEVMLPENASDSGASMPAMATQSASQATAATQSKSVQHARTTDEQAIAASAPQALSPQKNVAIQDDTAIYLDLMPKDWFWAAYRETAPLEWSTPTHTFNKEAALAQLKKVIGNKMQWQWDWDKAKIPSSPMPAEAHFWLMAMSSLRENQSNADFIAELEKQQFDGQLHLDDIDELIRNTFYRAQQYAIHLATAIIGPEAILKLYVSLFREPKSADIKWYSLEQISALRYEALPYTSIALRKELSVQLRSALNPADWPSDSYTRGPLAYYISAMLGDHDAILELVESWDDDMYTKQSWNAHYKQPWAILFGLKDPAVLIQHAQRLKLHLSDEVYIRAWLVHTGFSALNIVTKSILAHENKDQQAALIPILGLAIGPQTAPAMLELLKNSRAPVPARAWLLAHPTHTINGLLPVATGGGRQSADALEFLRNMLRSGYEQQIMAAMSSLNAAQAAQIQREVLDVVQQSLPLLHESDRPDWLREALAAQPKLKPTKNPAWLYHNLLPDLVLGEQRLDENLVLKVIQAIQSSTPERPHALLIALKAHAASASLASFAWAVFEQWLQGGAISKENWAMHVLGYLGDDSVALRLAALIRIWPGESQHQRAVTGLGVLRTIGSDTALMQINGIAQKVKFKALKEHAGEAMTQIAMARGLSRQELEDRIVPDCELDERGERSFDFGPRQFRFVLGADLKPMIRDAQGALKADLPKPNSKDNMGLAEQAIADWKLLKKQIAEVAKIQALRLEQSMVTGRRWSSMDFTNLLVRHPLMTHLVRTLVWGSYDAQGQLTQTFRVTEDQSYADYQDNGLTLAEGSLIGVVHPLHLSEALKGSWGELLSDYEIVQAFPQLGRPIYRLTDNEREATEITRFNTLNIAAASLVFGLDKQGWLRDAPADGGGFSGHSKQFLAAHVTAVVQYEDGVAVGYIIDAGEQNLEYIAFVPGLQNPDWWPQHMDRLPLKQIDAVVISEVLNDIQLVLAKAK